MFGMISYFYPFNLFLIPYGQYTKNYVGTFEEGDVVGIFINSENIEDDEEEEKE